MGQAEDGPQTPVAGTVRLRPDGVGLVLSGDFDLRSAPRLLDLLPRLLGNCLAAGAGQAEIDCAALTLCDSSGLTALIRAHQAAQDADISLVLTDRPGQLAHLLDLAGLSRMFEQGR
jgi:anti-sigma B factor antagonist